MDLDYQMLRRYAGYILTKMTLEQAKEIGFVQDANDIDHWNLAATDPEGYTADSPDTEIVDVAIHDMTIIDDMLARIKKK